jgi:antirestriction protein ArdC
MATNDKKREHRDIHQEVTNRIVAELEKGVMPWKRPWSAGSLSGTGSFLPRNAVNGRPYQGINTLLLLSRGYSDPRWCTYEKAQQQGWQVRKGEKATEIVLSKPQMRSKAVLETDPETGEEKSVTKTYKYWFAKAIRVFNAEQIEGIPDLEQPKGDAPNKVFLDRNVEEVLSRLKETGLTLGHCVAQMSPDGSDAWYRPSADRINMPHPERFPKITDYYLTLLHECGHATGHEKRLNRPFAHSFGTKDYAREELVAEISSALVSAELGIENDLKRNAAYIDNWLEVLKADKKEIFRAASQAQRACDLLMGRELEREMEEEKSAEQTGSPVQAASGLPSPGTHLVKEEFQTLSGILDPVRFFTYEETPPPGRRFDLNTPGVMDGGRRYQAITSDPHFADICNRLGPHEENRNGTLTPHGWMVLRGHYPKELDREFPPEGPGIAVGEIDLPGISDRSQEEDKKTAAFEPAL